MDRMIAMNIIRRAGFFLAAAVVVPFIALAASGCGGATPAASGATNALENKTPTQVVHNAAAAVEAVKSVEIVLTEPPAMGRWSQMDLRIQGGSRTVTVVENGIGKAELTIIGQYTYVKIGPAALNMLGGFPLAKSIFGRWVRFLTTRLNPGDLVVGTSPAFVAALLTHHGPLEPAVRQATLNGRKVVVITDQGNGAKLYIANTGPAYPLLITNPDGRRVDLSNYGANFHITAPSNAIPAR